MTFTYDGADLSKVIECIHCEDNNFNIYYLDGSKSTYVCSSEDEKEKIKKLMIEQAIERQKNIIYISALSSENMANVAGILGFAGLAVIETIFAKKLDLHALANLIITSLYTKKYLTTNAQLKELKKYKMFLELLDNLDEINLQFEENDLPLGIDTLDEFSYSEVKGWYKYYKKEKQLKKII